MPYLVGRKSGKKKKRYYVLEHQTINGKARQFSLEKLGACTYREAKKALARHVLYSTPGSGYKITVEQATEAFFYYYERRIYYYERRINMEISPRTYQLALEQQKTIVDFFGPYPLNAIDFDLIEKFKWSLSKFRKLSNRSINIHLVTLRKILTSAMDKNWIYRMPKIKSLPEHYLDKEVEFLTEAQVKKVLAQATPKQSFYIKILVHTGMRPCEFNRSRWDQVNFKEKYIDILSDNPLKRGRRIPIHPSIMELLQEAYKKRGENERVSPYKKTKYVSQRLARLKKVTGVNFTPYTLRKTFGSWLVQHGVDIMTVAELMGHRSITTTRKHYIRLLDDNLKSAMDKLKKDSIF